MEQRQPTIPCLLSTHEVEAQMSTIKKNDKYEWEIISGNCRWTLGDLTLEISDHRAPTLDEVISIYNRVGRIPPMFGNGKQMTPERLYIKGDESPSTPIIPESQVKDFLIEPMLCLNVSNI